MFQQLKKLFTLVLILVQPDPKRELIVEVDASSTRVEAMLSQNATPSAH